LKRDEFEVGRKKLLKFMRLSENYKRPKSQWHPHPDKEKLLEITDEHEPYGYEPVFLTAEAEHKDAHALHSGGDIGDFYSKSRFPKVHAEDFKSELRSVFLRLEWMATHWRTVYLTLGNHDPRPEKTLLAGVKEPELLVMLSRTTLVERLADFFDNIEVVGTRTANPDITLSHLWQYGDIIFTHAERSLQQRSALMEKLSQQLYEKKGLYRLKPYRIIAQGHNHTATKISNGNHGETWFQMPSSADPFGIGMEYSHSAKMIGRAPCIGYTLFYQSNGETDINRSNYFLVD